MSKLMLKTKSALRAKTIQLEQLEKWTDSINNPSKTEPSSASQKRSIPVPILGSLLTFTIFLWTKFEVSKWSNILFNFQLKAVKSNQKRRNWSHGWLTKWIVLFLTRSWLGPRTRWRNCFIWFCLRTCQLIIKYVYISHGSVTAACFRNLLHV